MNLEHGTPRARAGSSSDLPLLLLLLPLGYFFPRFPPCPPELLPLHLLTSHPVLLTPGKGAGAVAGWQEPIPWQQAAARH